MSSPKDSADIRRLRAADARNYRSALVEALIVHPECFPEDYRAEISRPISSTEEELERNGIFGAWVDGVLAGIVSGIPCTASKRRHSGRIQNLYVKEKFRRRGVASLLLRALLQFASCDLEQLEVEVPAKCESVVCLFERFGFRMCGLMPGGIRVGQEGFDVWTMVRRLR